MRKTAAVYDLFATAHDDAEIDDTTTVVLSTLSLLVVILSGALAASFWPQSPVLTAAFTLNAATAALIVTRLILPKLVF